MSMTMIQIEAADGSAEAYFTRPDGDQDVPGVIVFGDAFGLRQRLFDMADRIAGWGYAVLEPNLFYRDGTIDVVSVQGDLRTPGVREAHFGVARPRIDRVTPDLVLADVASFVDALRAQPGVAEGPIGVVGYCMGARYAVRAAGAHPGVVAAVGGFHGGGVATDAADSPHLSIATSTAEFVFGHADGDQSMPPEAVDRIGAAIADAGLVGTNEVYDGAPHGYSMADTAVYHEEATERHFRELEALLARTLRR